MRELELLSCMGCQRIIDHTIMPAKCDCGTRFFKAVEPTKAIVLKWFFSNFKHASKVVFEYFREKYNETRSKYRNTLRPGN